MNTAVNYEFPIISLNRDEYNAISNWIQTHALMLSQKKLYIFGAGIRGNLMLKLLEENGINVTGFGDNSIEKQKGYLKQYPILSMDEICRNPKDSVILVSPENYHEIEKMLEAKGRIKNVDFFVIDNTTYKTFYRNFFEKDHINYILFGDCFFTELDIDDLEGRTMGELARNTIGYDKTKILSLQGLCIPGFYYLMKEQINLGIQPKAVAFIVNVPFCNGIQTKLPQSQHSLLFKQISEALPHDHKDFSAYVQLTEERSKNINADAFSTKNVRNSVNIEKILTKTRYMYDLKGNNENVLYMIKLIHLLQSHNIKPVPFIPALNYSSAVEWFGSVFSDKYGNICKELKKYCEKEGAELLDMSMLLNKDYFTGGRVTKFPNDNGKLLEIEMLKNALEK